LGGVTPCYAYYVRGYVRFWDSRTQYVPNGGDTSGAHFTYEDIEYFDPDYSHNVFAEGVKIYVYAKRGSCRDKAIGCSETDDVLLGSTYSGSAGFYSVSGAVTGDVVYIYHKYCNRFGCIKDDDGNYLTKVSTNSTINGAHIWKDINLTCSSSNNNFCVDQNDVSDNYSQEEAFADILQSMNDVYKYLGDLSENGHTSSITVYYPNKPGETECTSGYGGYSYPPNTACVSSYKGNMLIAHEMGHILFYRLLFEPGDNDCTMGGCGSAAYGWTDYAANEKCVISEAWATFIAGVVYFDEDADVPYYSTSTHNFEGDTTAGNSGSRACVQNKTTPVNIKTPHLCRGNAARYFWDLYDSTTNGDDGNDNTNLTISQINGIWQSFINGTSNRRDCESDADGRNVYDYRHYETQIASILDTSDEMTQNCLDDQDQN